MKAVTIGLFGAAFDPPHRGHQKIVSTLIRQHWVDQVWVVPVKSHPFEKKLTADADRLAMVSLMVQSLYQSGLTKDQVRVETYELLQSGVSYSYQTLQALSALFPHFSFKWVIGADNVAHFHRWSEYKALLDRFSVLVYPRPGFENPDLLPGMQLVTDVEPIPISSTDARAELAAGGLGIDLVLPEIAQYSKAHQLYVPDSSIAKPNE